MPYKSWSFHDSSIRQPSNSIELLMCPSFCRATIKRICYRFVLSTYCRFWWSCCCWCCCSMASLAHWLLLVGFFLWLPRGPPTIVGAAPAHTSALLRRAPLFPHSIKNDKCLVALKWKQHEPYNRYQQKKLFLEERGRRMGGSSRLMFLTIFNVPFMNADKSNVRAGGCWLCLSVIIWLILLPAGFGETVGTGPSVCRIRRLNISLMLLLNCTH